MQRSNSWMPNSLCLCFTKVDARTKEIYFLHGLCTPGKGFNSPDAARAQIQELTRTDISTEVSSRVESELRNIQSWWQALKAKNLPFSSSEYNWSVEELRASLFSRISTLIRLHQKESVYTRVIYQKV
jgi:hypothetical protein